MHKPGYGGTPPVRHFDYPASVGNVGPVIPQHKHTLARSVVVNILSRCWAVNHFVLSAFALATWQAVAVASNHLLWWSEAILGGCFDTAQYA